VYLRDREGTGVSPKQIELQIILQNLVRTGKLRHGMFGLAGVMSVTFLWFDPGVLINVE